MSTLTDQVLARVAAALPGVTVYDAMVPPTPADRYVIVRSNTGLLTGGAMCLTPDEADFRYWVTYVSSTADARWQIEWMVGKVRPALQGALLAEAGWVTSPVRQVDSQPMSRDEQVVARPTLYAVDQFQLLATAA